MVSYHLDGKDDDQVFCGCQIPCRMKLEHRLVQFFTRLGEGFYFSKIRDSLHTFATTKIFLTKFLISACATHPWKILFLGVVPVIVFTCGGLHVDTTIDPVELWTSNGSRCRQERQYFNENFGPFYRIQQVIVTAKNLQNVIVFSFGRSFCCILTRVFDFCCIERYGCVFLTGDSKFEQWRRRIWTSVPQTIFAGL